MAEQLKSQGKNLVSFPQFQHDGETQVNSDFIQYNLDVSSDSRWFIASTHPMARIRLPYVQEIGEFAAKRNYMTTRTHLPSFLLKITLDGEGFLRYDDLEYYTQRGEFFLIDCRHPHYYSTSPRADFWKVIWIHFWGGDAQEYYRCFWEVNHGSPKSILRTPESVQIIRNLIQDYSAELYTDYRTDVKASSQISTLLSNCVLSVLEGNDKLSLQTPPKFVFEVRNYIAEHYQERITLDFLAEKFYVNKFYLHKQFQLYLHTTPREFQKNLRINKAKEFLRASTLSVGDIADNLGFDTPSYFISSFRKAEGKTPLQYRHEWGA